MKTRVKVLLLVVAIPLVVPKFMRDRQRIEI